MPGGLCKFDPPLAHHKFLKEDTALRTMYKHIIKDKRHSNFIEHTTSYLDSSIDQTDVNNMSSIMSKRKNSDRN